MDAINVVAIATATIWLTMISWIQFIGIREKNRQIRDREAIIRFWEKYFDSMVPELMDLASKIKDFKEKIQAKDEDLEKVSLFLWKLREQSGRDQAKSD